MNFAPKITKEGLKTVGKHVGGPLAADAVSATITAGLVSKKIDKANAANGPTRVAKKSPCGGMGCKRCGM